MNDIRSLAKWITAVESRDPAALQRLASLQPGEDRAYRIGVTGPPGAGKSTLVDRLIGLLRARGEKVAIVAIDPSSPFSGGAVLGDRIRMQAHAGDDHVFIRSVGSRGAHGGLSRAARAITRILAAYQYNWIIVETVGVGQSEFDIMELADTTVVVLVPEAGDTVQTMKAGLLEVADCFVVNKADRKGAGEMASGLKAMLALAQVTGAEDAGSHDASHRITSKTRQLGRFQSSRFEHSATDAPEMRRLEPSPMTHLAWQVPVLETTATQGVGVEALFEAILRHRDAVANDPAHAAGQADVRRQELFELCGSAFLEQLQGRVAVSKDLQTMIAAVACGEANPYEMAEKMLKLCGDG